MRARLPFWVNFIFGKRISSTHVPRSRPRSRWILTFLGPTWTSRKFSREKRDLQTGLRVLGEGLAACPDSAELHHEYALALAAKGDTEEALRHFREAQRRDPKNPAAYQDFALLCFRLGREAEGVNALETAQKEVPEDREILTLLARYQIHAGNEASAVEFLHRAQNAGIQSDTQAELRQAFERQFGHTLDR